MNIWQRVSLRKRIYLLMASLVFVTFLGGFIMMWYTYRSERVLTSIINRDIVAFQSATALEDALVNQKGFVSYYFIDNDPEWLKQLGEYRQIFKEKLKEARTLAENSHQKEAIDQIEREYRLYISGKDRVIDYYMAGKREAGLQLHQKVREHYFAILDLCEQYKNIHRNRMIKAQQKSHDQAQDLRFIAGFAMIVIFILSIYLAFILAKQILDPLRKLAQETALKNSDQKPDNEVKAISRSVHGLIEDAGLAQIELERSREHLLQAEKLAMVGKLAAGVAHSIRNPLTSVKMRLFSLNRSLQLNDHQKEDFEVISEEIRHTDTIVQNFLEFSRPPKLKMQPISPSLVVDQTLQLLQHRLKSYDIDVQVNRKQPLPVIEADPEQLKEVFVNLIENACEAMEPGGIIVVEEETVGSPSDHTVRIQVADNGPGIPDSIQKRLFEPFFTTKDEGTGLGLSIAARIVQEHRGRLDVTSKEGEGTAFTITLPLKDLGHEQNPDH